eukprot:3941301-Amphidinium_carterae.1
MARDELVEVQDKFRTLPTEPLPEPAKPVCPVGPAPAELKLLLAYVQAKASEGCGDANSMCGLLQHSGPGGGNQVAPIPETNPAVEGEWTQVGPGGSCKRRA